MLMVNIADAKAKLSEYMEAVARGEQVIICNRNRPVAELRAIVAPLTGARDLTPLFPGETFMTDAFFEPMSDEEIEQWEGPGVLPARVAETRAPYGALTAKAKGRKRRS
jgi:antitoxin (DNA-binding transcriptional repressor) of toxin-antitoxin stability system